MHYAFRLVTDQFAAAPGERPPAENFAAWLRAKLVETTEEAEIEEPSPEGEVWTIWLDIGGDRFHIELRSGSMASEWSLSLEHQAPMFVRGHEGNARHQSRFDALVAQVRHVVLQARGARLLAETDD